MKKSKFNISLLTFILLAGIWLNPNTLLAGVPIYIYLMLERQIRMPEIPWLVYGAIPVIVMGIWEKYFYFSNPEISIFRNSDFHFSVSNFYRGIQHLDVYFNYLMPKGGTVLFLMIIFIYIYNSDKKWSSLISLIAGLFILFGSLFLEKIYDCNASVFYPCARMFLTIPVWVSFLLLGFPVKKIPFACFPITVIVVGFFSIWAGLNVQATIYKEVAINPEKLYWVDIPDTRENCAYLYKLSKEKKIDILITDYYFVPEVYACPCLYKDFPPFLISYWDRRYWRHYQYSVSKYQVFGYLPDLKNKEFMISPPGVKKMDSVLTVIPGQKLYRLQYPKPISSLTFYKINDIPHRPVFIP